MTVSTKAELQASSSSSAGSSQKEEQRDLREQALDEDEVFLRRRQERKEKELKTAKHENKGRNQSHFSGFALVVCLMKAEWRESHGDYNNSDYGGRGHCENIMG